MGLIDSESPVLSCPASFLMPDKIDTLISDIENSSDCETPDRLLDCIHLVRMVLNQKKENKIPESLRLMIQKSCLNFDKLYTSRFDLKDYCRWNGIGYESFRKVFKQVTGMSPGHYLMKRRMEAACRLLKNRNMAVSHVVEELGYHSPFEFSAQFKRYIGLSPHRFQTGYI